MGVPSAPLGYHSLKASSYPSFPVGFRRGEMGPVAGRSQARSHVTSERWTLIPSLTTQTSKFPFFTLPLD